MLTFLNRFLLGPLRFAGDMSLRMENSRLKREVDRLDHENKMLTLSTKRYAALHEMNMEFIDANRAWFTRQAAELTTGMIRQEQPRG